MSEQTTLPEEQLSPPWNRTTRRIVAIIFVLIVGFILWRFQGLLVQVIVASVLAYLLNPVIDFLVRRTPLNRAVATILLYLLLVLILLAALAMIGVAVFNEVKSLIDVLPTLINQVVGYLSGMTNDPEAAINIGPLHIALNDIDWTRIQEQMINFVNPALRSGPAAAGRVASSAFDVIGWFVLTLVISVYIAVDLPRMQEDFNQIAKQSGYYHDFMRLKEGLLQIGNAYLRGQVILGLVVGTMTGVLLGILGVKNALALGILAGILEMVPYFGPIFSAIVAILVAFFQPGNYLGLGHFEFALATLGVMILVQQLENNFFVPRIVGDALNLQPLTVMIAVIMGGAIAGILGIILAGPVAAAVKLVGGYLWRKMLGLPAFPPEQARHLRGPSLVGRTLGRIRRRPRAAVREGLVDPDNPEDTIPPPAAAA